MHTEPEKYESDFVIYKPKPLCEECKRFEATQHKLCDICIFGYNHITIIYLVNLKYKKH